MTSPPSIRPSGDPGTLDLPWYGIGFVDAVRRGFQKYVRFDGRASRSEYWYWALSFAVGTIVLDGLWYVVDTVDSPIAVLLGSSAFSLTGAAFALATLIPSVAVSVRRLHDAGHSGWACLFMLIPILGTIVFLVLMCLPSRPEGARFDRRPQGPLTG